MATGHAEMQVGVVACETLFRTYAHKDGLGSALNKCVCLCMCPQWDHFLLLWWKATPFFHSSSSNIRLLLRLIVFGFVWSLDPTVGCFHRPCLSHIQVSFPACQLGEEQLQIKWKTSQSSSAVSSVHAETFSAIHAAGGTSFPLGFTHMGQTLFVDDPCCLWYLVCIAILSVGLGKAFFLHRISRLLVSCAHVVTISQKSLVIN